MSSIQQDWQFIRSLFWPSKSEAAFVALVVKNGFTDIMDYFNVIAQVGAITPAFVAWRKTDNTKAGLLKIIAAAK